MQTQKKDIRKTILEVSMREFLEHGFKDASMRTIAKKSGVSLSNIYNYFKNKDEIFTQILSVPVSLLNKVNNLFDDEYFFDIENIRSGKIKQLKFTYSIKFICNYRDELNLLLFKAHGSSLQNFKDNWIDENTVASIKWIKKYNHIHSKKIKASEFFIHNLNSSYVNFITEILMHDIHKNKMIEYLKEYFEYSFNGWQKIIGK
ncbi:MAG: TetR/AcrR family transcriptional regulator [Bacteroidales bacterium]|jgi:predicted DNA-binding protein YlxM (UPF0122 family)|nr:TetR/AcrR family transcriptional regulator [Bacteroidales bacterium]